MYTSESTMYITPYFWPHRFSVQLNLVLNTAKKAKRIHASYANCIYEPKSLKLSAYTLIIFFAFTHHVACNSDTAFLLDISFLCLFEYN